MRCPPRPISRSDARATLDDEKEKTIVQGVPDVAIFAGVAVFTGLVFAIGLKCGGGKREDQSIELYSTEDIPDGDIEAEGNTTTTMSPGDNA